MERIIYALGSGSNTPRLLNGVASFRLKSYCASIKVGLKEFWGERQRRLLRQVVSIRLEYLGHSKETVAS